jgi:hypothetical protein
VNPLTVPEGILASFGSVLDLLGLRILKRRWFFPGQPSRPFDVGIKPLPFRPVAVVLVRQKNT